MEFTFEDFKRVCSELFPDAGEFTCRSALGIGKIFTVQITVRTKPHILHLMTRPRSEEVNIYSIPPTATVYRADGAEIQLRALAKDIKKLG